MSIKLHGVTSQQGENVAAVSSDLNYKQTTPSDLFTDTLTIKLLTHSTIRQRHINPITGIRKKKKLINVHTAEQFWCCSCALAFRMPMFQALLHTAQSRHCGAEGYLQRKGQDSQSKDS